MLKTTFTLTDKKQLTYDVYELHYSCPDMMQEPPKPGQYVMFQLAPGLNRAYSIASFGQDSFMLIIKRIPDGRGSPMICDAEVGTTFSGMLSLGHFTLRDTPEAKCFVGTGTGFAPLYCQMLHTLPESKVAFVFWVRNFRDDFYSSEIRSIGERFEDFQYVHYFSRETEFDSQIANHESRTGYVTEWITEESIRPYGEFYLCGSPAMVKDAREKLENLGISKEKIFWEQF